MSNSWLVYVGVLFICMVIFAPNGIMGLVFAHRPIAHAGKMGRLLVPYARLIIPVILLVFGFVGLVELTSFLTIGAAQGKTLVLFGNRIDVHNMTPWAISLASLLVGGAWLRVEARSFHRVWEALMFEIAPPRVAT
jgi:branched-chain amino acid transport system permease protein